MKNDKILIRSLFVIGALLLFLYCTKDFWSTLWSEISYERQKELRANFFTPSYEVQDTIIHYELYPDSLVLRFHPKAHYKRWHSQVHLIDTLNGGGISINNSENYPVINNCLTYVDFEVPPESLKNYVPEFFAFPNTEALILRKSLANNRIQFVQKSENPVLTPFFPMKTRKYMLFHMNSLKGLSKAEYNYCWSIFQKETGIDLEIDDNRFR